MTYGLLKMRTNVLYTNKAIPQNGLMWDNLVMWYSTEFGIDENQEIVFLLLLKNKLGNQRGK